MSSNGSAFRAVLQAIWRQQQARRSLPMIAPPLLSSAQYQAMDTRMTQSLHVHRIWTIMTEQHRLAWALVPWKEVFAVQDGDETLLHHSWTAFVAGLPEPTSLNPKRVSWRQVPVFPAAAVERALLLFRQRGGAPAAAAIRTWLDMLTPKQVRPSTDFMEQVMKKTL